MSTTAMTPPSSDTTTTITPPSSDTTTAIATPCATSTPVMPGVAENSNFKNRLQEYTQRASIPLPSYATKNVDGSYPPQFSSSVTVDGETYTSLSTFPNKKAAEQDIAKLAFEGINKKIKESIFKENTIGGFPPIFQDKVFCKSILHEFAMKMNMQKPEYENYMLEGRVHLFSTSVIFNGVKYVGAPAVNKKEAEQLGARTVILSILADSEIGMKLSEVIKSKAKLFSVPKEIIHANEVPVPSVEPNVGAALETSAMKGFGQGTGQTGSATGNVVAAALPNEGVDQAGNVFGTVVTGVVEGESHGVPRHEFRKPEAEIFSPAVTLPIAFVPSLGEQTPVTASGKKRKNKKKKKAAKKAKMEIEAQASEILVNQGMP